MYSTKMYIIHKEMYITKHSLCLVIIEGRLTTPNRPAEVTKISKITTLRGTWNGSELRVSTS